MLATSTLIRVSAVAAVVLAAALLAGCGPSSEPARAVPADAVVFTGPRFWTGDASRPWAEVAVVREGRILALGARHEAGPFIAQGARLVTLPGAVAVPGLVDAHAHILGLGEARRSVDLVGTVSLEESLERVAAFARMHPDQPWIVGRGWDQNDWERQEWPDADRLDQIVADRPVALTRIDGHALWANRAALAIARIDEKTPDPPGGKIQRDASGRPNGILIDTAADLVTNAIPEPSEDAIASALEAAAQEAVALGLTGVHDMGIDARTWEAMLRLQREQRFPLRVTAYASAGSDLHETLVASGPVAIGFLRAVGVKLYADGALGSRGARLLEPYSDQKAVSGLWITEPTALKQAAANAAQAGLQVAIHAIGDAANRAALDAASESVRVALARGGAPQGGARPRIEHAQIVASSDIARFRDEADRAYASRSNQALAREDIAIVASMQPTHATSDMPWAELRVGRERLAGAYAWRSMLAAGVPLAFGSDFPVESADPRLGLHAAVTRRDVSGRPAGGWFPEQRLSLEEALAAFTIGAAYAAMQERETGILAPGRNADLTVFGRDLFVEDPSGLIDNPIAATVIGGEIVYRAP